MGVFLLHMISSDRGSIVFEMSFSGGRLTPGEGNCHEVAFGGTGGGCRKWEKGGRDGGGCGYGGVGVLVGGRIGHSSSENSIKSLLPCSEVVLGR